MGDKATLAKARIELEELYLGIPDESVNLTFGDLADVKQVAAEKKKQKSLEPISEKKRPKEHPPLHKLPSLDFSRGLEAANNYHHHHHFHHGIGDSIDSHTGHHHHHLDVEGLHASHGHHYVKDESHHHANPNSHTGFKHAVNDHLAYDPSSMSTASMYQARGGRRPGIPHSNICTICSTYIYILKHRCLVCGRVYCRNCVSIGMGEMAEGRKCIECLGRRFSQRYIQRAGKVGCCSRYPSTVKQAELKWAEKGPRRNGERRYSHSVMMPRSRSPITPRTPTRSHAINNDPPSFVTSTPYTPYSPNHHPMPF